jgi:spermidine/putrescine transport system substrate-binding protein
MHVESLPVRAGQRLLRSVLACGLLLCLPFAAAADPPELAVLTWANYVDPAVVAAFEARCDCRVTLLYYQTDDARDELMVESDGRGYDVVLLNGLMLHTYRERGWLRPVDAGEIPNLAHVAPYWRRAFDGAEQYGVPYFWGTLGIAYREDLVTTPVRRWSDLLQPAAELQGRIAMIDSARDLLSAPLKSLGESLNTTEPEALDAARELLLAQKPHVRSYSYVALNGESALVTGDIVAAMMYNGDALMLQALQPAIRFVLPDEGGLVWVDYLVILRHADEPRLAAAFIDFLNEPAMAARNARFVHYATPNLAAERLLPDAFRADPLIYPDAETLRQSEFHRRLPPRVESSYNDIFIGVVE